MSWRELAEDVLLLSGSPNTAMIIHNQIAFVVDPGNGEGRAKSIHRKAESYGVAARFAMLTHGHIDHFAECKGFDRIFIHRYDVGLAENDVIRNVLEFNTLSTKGFKFISGSSVRVTDTLWWGDDIVGIQAVNTHGHTPGHSAYVFGEFAYVGDAVFGNRLVDRVKILFHTDVPEAMKSLDTVEKLAREGKTIIPGHGPVVSGEEAIALVQKNREAIEQMMKDLWDVLDEPGTLEEITIRLMEHYNLKLEPEFVLLDMTPVRSILSHWREEGRVKIRVERRGVIWEQRGQRINTAKRI